MMAEKAITTPDQILEQGECLYTNTWDTGGGPGFNGYSAVYRFEERYFVLNINNVLDGIDLDGPFPSLERALTDSQDLLAVGPGTEEIECSTLGTTDLARRLFTIYFEFEGEAFVKEIKINGESFLASAEGIVRISTAKQVMCSPEKPIA